MKYLILILLFFLSSHWASAQVYPKWFIEQGNFDADNTAVGYARHSFYTDSSIAAAFNNACENYAKNKKSIIKGGQAFWSTETGTFSMGNNFTETFDSTQYFGGLNSFIGIDTLITDKLIIILIGDSNKVSGRLQRGRIFFSNMKSPGWINFVPNDSIYIYAVGVAPEYFYETSSWLEAERLARLNLARRINVHLKSIQKINNREGQEIREEETSVILKDVQIVSRWRDLKKKLFFVLIKMLK